MLVKMLLLVIHLDDCEYYLLIYFKFILKFYLNETNKI